MKTVKLMIEVELDGDTEQSARDAVKTLLGESYYSATAVEIYNPEHAERAAFLVLDNAFIVNIRSNNEPVMKLQGSWDKLHKDLVKAMDPIESARELQRAKEIS
jgi:hypothetical protein